MRVLFADAVYWAAIINPRDSLHRRASQIPETLGQYRVVTSEMVLVEVLNAISGHGSHLRLSAVNLVQDLASDPDIEVVPQSTKLFQDAFALYHDRPDKGWSLTDCASFVIMDERRITEALTHDRHFEQKGYRGLLRD